ncbi:MAG: cytidine deaminase [Flavobacteriales bacterium]
MARQRTYRLVYLEHANWKSLPTSDHDLLLAAQAAARKAYAKYSRFKVGAALRTTDGRMTIGSNQENASFPAGTCAERTALHACMALSPNAYVDVIAVVVPKAKGKDPIPPCGICRQALVEQERRQGGPLRVLLGAPDGEVLEIGSAEGLLPLSFDASFLK